MSNRVHIERLEFRNRQNTITYGYRIWDNYACEYNDTFEYNDTLLKIDNLDFLKLLINKNELYLTNTAREILDYVTEYMSGISIDNQWYDWEEIKDILTINIKDIK